MIPTQTGADEIAWFAHVRNTERAR
jgi:hypothetical protein